MLLFFTVAGGLATLGQTSTLKQDLDREWAVRHGCEQELVSAVALLVEFGRRLTVNGQEHGLKGARRRSVYAASGRLLRLGTAVQRQLWINNKHHRF